MLVNLASLFDYQVSHLNRKISLGAQNHLFYYSILCKSFKNRFFKTNVAEIPQTPIKTIE
jgi:hypothetical protein